MAVQLTREDAATLGAVFEMSDEELALLDELLETDVEAGWRGVLRRAPAYMQAEPAQAPTWGKALIERWERMRLALNIVNNTGPALASRGRGPAWTKLTEEEQRNLAETFGSPEAAAEALGDSSEEYRAVRASAAGQLEDLPLPLSGKVYRVGSELKVELSLSQSDARTCGMAVLAWRAWVELVDGDRPVVTLGPLYPDASNDLIRLNTVFALPDDVALMLGSLVGGLPAAFVRIRIEEVA